MKLFKAVLSVSFMFSLLLAGVAGAQSYEGADVEDGIFFVPNTPAGGEEVNFKAEGLQPNADVTFQFLDENNEDVDGLTVVAGAVVLRANASGAIDADVRLPANLAEGSYTLVVTSTKADGSPFETSWSFVIGGQVGSTSSSDNDSDALALTGSNSRTTAVGAGVLVLLGLGLVGIATTRRREDVLA